MTKTATSGIETASGIKMTWEGLTAGRTYRIAITEVDPTPPIQPHIVYLHEFTKLKP